MFWMVQHKIRYYFSLPVHKIWAFCSSSTLRGRSGHTKVFLPFVPFSDVTQNVFLLLAHPRSSRLKVVFQPSFVSRSYAIFEASRSPCSVRREDDEGWSSGGSWWPAADWLHLDFLLCRCWRRQFGPFRRNRGALLWSRRPLQLCAWNLARRRTPFLKWLLARQVLMNKGLRRKVWQTFIIKVISLRPNNILSPLSFFFFFFVFFGN